MAQQDPAVVAVTAGALRDGIMTLLTELRNLVQGIMPAPLVERGVFSAIRALPGQVPVPLDVDVQGRPRRLPSEIESTIYFVVLEAVTNAVKHAGAEQIKISVMISPDRITADVRDDGIGGAMVGAGSGLLGLRDRLAAFGGTLRLPPNPAMGLLSEMMVPCG